jgi:Family of unknown function (DUF5947)
VATTALNRVRQFGARSRSTERCELCGSDVDSQHEHLLDSAERRLLCACGACAVLFERTTTRKRVPRRVRLLADFHMSDAQWDALGIPINLAFFVASSLNGRWTAYYPSPAGATESLLPLDTWEDIGIAPDVEALLVNRSVPEYFIAPIDECYRLVGLIRTQWSGLSGGAAVWESIADFFNQLRHRA